MSEGTEAPPPPAPKRKMSPEIQGAVIGAAATLLAAIVGVIKCNASEPKPIAKAISPYERVMSLYREGADLFVDRSFELARVKLESAVLEAKQSKVVAPDPLGLLGAIQYNKAAYDRSNSLDYEALRNLEKAIDDGCDLPYVRRTYAKIMLRDGGMNNAFIAQKQYQLAFEDDPGTGFDYEGLGEAFRRQNKLEEAERSFQKAIELDPSYSLVLIGLAKTQFMMRRDSEAIQTFKKAIDLSDRLGQTDWRITLERDPEVAELRQNPEFMAILSPPPTTGAGF